MKKYFILSALIATLIGAQIVSARIQNPASTVGFLTALTPWTENVDGGGFALSNVSTITSTNLSVTNATSTGKLNIPNGASPSVVTTGDVAVDTTSDQLIGFGSTAKKVYGNGNIYAGFTYATSTTAVGTTTIPLGTARVSEIWNDATCYTDVGTWQVSFNDGTNRMNFMNSSTTANVNTISTNGTIFTAGTKRYVDIGTPLSAPTKVSCTISKSIIAD